MDFPALIAFLSELALNNNKPWFEEHRPLTNDCAASGSRSSARSSTASRSSIPAWASCRRRMPLFRINRDIRFSKDKTALQDDVQRGHLPAGPQQRPARLLLPRHRGGRAADRRRRLHAGTRHPGQIRKHIAEHPERLSEVLADPAFTATFGTIGGERLKRPPQGYDETTPHIEFIKLKSFTADVEPHDWLARSDALAEEIAGGVPRHVSADPLAARGAGRRRRPRPPVAAGDRPAGRVRGVGRAHEHLLGRSGAF